MLNEIATAKAEEEATRTIEEEENLSAVLISETLIQDVKQNPAPKIEPVESNTPKYEDNLNPGAPTFVPLRKLDASQSKGGNAVQSPSVENTGAEPPIKTEELSSVVKLIAEQQRMSLLPVQRPPVFSGDYFDYATFINAFESLIGLTSIQLKTRKNELRVSSLSTLQIIMRRKERCLKKDSETLIV